MKNKRVASVLLLMAIGFASEPARAEDEGEIPDRDSIIFEYGQTCENLGQLSRVELVGITHRTYEENFALFCRPDSVYRCEDYNSLLVGLGRLEDNGRSSCRYLPDAP